MRKKQRRRKKGSITVEAAMVVPLCVLVIAVLLSLTFYVYLRCWYTQTGCEASIQGSAYGVLGERDGREKTLEKWKTRRKESGFTGKNISAEITGNKREVQIRITGKIPVWGRKSLQFHSSVRQKILRPVSLIRKAAALRT